MVKTENALFSLLHLLLSRSTEVTSVFISCLDGKPRNFPFDESRNLKQGPSARIHGPVLLYHESVNRAEALSSRDTAFLTAR